MSALRLAAAHRHVEPLEARWLLSQTIYVDLNAPGPTHDGSSWNAAYLSLQDALGAAQAGDQIYVADGTYTPGPNSTDTFDLGPNVALKGGYAGSGAANPDARDVQMFKTILTNFGDFIAGGAAVITAGPSIDIASLIDGFTIKSPGAGMGIYNNAGSPTINDCTFTGASAIQNANGSSAVINGCSFIDGEGDGDGAMINMDSSPLITNCTFERYHGAYAGAIANMRSTMIVRNSSFIHCTATHRGNAVWNYSGSATFFDCDFSQNNSQWFSESGAIESGGGSISLTRCTFTENINNEYAGGAIYNTGATLTADHCTFTRNGGPSYGGAIYTTGPSATITNCIFHGNGAGMLGGAIYADTSLTLTNCVFTGNSTGSSEGGGGALAGGGTITNCTFSGNSTRAAGGAILPSGSLNIRNSILWNDSAADTDEIYLSGTTSVNLDHDLIGGPSTFDPRFVRNPSLGPDGYWGTADDDYGDLRLRSNSPAVDAGNNDAVSGTITKDILGNSRFVDYPGVNDPGAIVDIGAYEIPPPTTVTAAGFEVDAPRPSISVTFAENIDGSILQAADLTLYPHGPAIHGDSSATVSYDPQTRTATWAFSILLPDGDYRAVLAASPLQQAYSFDFFSLAGDANRDRVVDTSDLGILATNWQGSGKTFSQGDFNYDGVVNVSDLGILASHWQKSLPAPSAAPPAVSATASPASLSTTRRLAQDLLS